MAAIQIENYLNIADFYANTSITTRNAVDYFYDAAYEIVLLQVFDPEMDLLIPFYNAYLSAQTAYNRPLQATVAAVAALQSHVLNRARAADGTTRFDNISDWLDASNTYSVAGSNIGRLGDTDTSYKVPSDFATLSLQAGYAIDSALQS